MMYPRSISYICYSYHLFRFVKSRVKGCHRFPDTPVISLFLSLFYTDTHTLFVLASFFFFVCIGGDSRLGVPDGVFCKSVLLYFLSAVKESFPGLGQFAPSRMFLVSKIWIVGRFASRIRQGGKKVARLYIRCHTGLRFPSNYLSTQLIVRFIFQ